jgi:phosphoglycolate phosphatase
MLQKEAGKQAAAKAAEMAAAKAAGVRQSILSAYRDETLREIVAHFGLTSHFDHIAGLDNIHAHSKVALGRDLVSRLGALPSEILLVGDTLHDLEVARALGVDCALIAAGHHPMERLQASGAAVFPDLAAFAAGYGFQGISASGAGKI